MNLRPPSDKILGHRDAPQLLENFGNTYQDVLSNLNHFDFDILVINYGRWDNWRVSRTNVKMKS